MKSYVKPSLTILAADGANPLAPCIYDAVGPNMSPEIQGLLGNLGYSPEEQKQCFNAGEDCSIKVTDSLAYCKFGPGGKTVFNS